MKDDNARYVQTGNDYSDAKQKAGLVSDKFGSDSKEAKAANLDVKIKKAEYDQAIKISDASDQRYRKASKAYNDALDAADKKGCQRPSPSYSESFYFLIQTLKNSGQLDLAERLAETGKQTFGATDRVDPLGFGIGFGYNFAPWNNNVMLGAFGTFDVLNQTINHDFAGGSFIGTRSRWIGTAGLKFGVTAARNWFFYGLGGVGLLNQDVTVNFGAPFVTSKNTTVPGVTAGLGVEVRPRFLQRFGRPISLFAQYQHTWWADAHLDQPFASPLFNYGRQDDTVKFGLNIYFGGPALSRR
jgi:hypothetical protein